MNPGQRSPDLDKRGKTKTSGNIHHWKHPSDSCSSAAAFRSVLAHRTFRTWTLTLKKNLAAPPPGSCWARPPYWTSGVIPVFRVLPVLPPSSSTGCNN